MLGKRKEPVNRICRSCEKSFLQTSAGWAQKLCPDCKKKIEKPSKANPSGPKVDPKKEIERLTPTEIEDLRKHLRWGGYRELAKTPTTHEFLKAFKRTCEGSLFMLAKFVLGMSDLSEHLHHPVCDWLQDVSKGRYKLLMLPVAHLKTSIASHAFPIWAMIQPADRNLLFHSFAGYDLRILLQGESTDRALENMKVISQNLESNRILRYLWKDVFWSDPRREAVEHGGVWAATALTVRRRKILPEPTITAIGVGTGVEGRHYDIIIIDDLACFDAALSEVTMNRAKMKRRSLRSRLNDPTRSIEIGVGTHWTPTDIYVEWKKDPDVSVMIRSAIENGEAIWPERHPLESLLAKQAEEGMGKVLFSANWMNNPLNAAFCHAPSPGRGMRQVASMK